MSADELRKAAETLRERAEDSSPAPWDPDGNAVRSGRMALALTYNSHDDRDQKRKDANYIATMHPGVGLALADWMDAEAAIYEKLERVAVEVGHDGWKLTWGESTLPQSEALARLINGGAA